MIVGDEVVGGVKEGLGGAVVGAEGNDGGLRKFFEKGKSVFQRSTLKTIDGLVRIANNKEVGAATPITGKKMNDLILSRVGILIFVN